MKNNYAQIQMNYFFYYSTGVERKISGLMKMSGKFGEGTYNVRYNSLPINYDTTLNVLDTDYDSFAVIYSCSALGSVGHTRKYTC